MVSQGNRSHCKVQNEWMTYDITAFLLYFKQKMVRTHHSHSFFKSTNQDFSVGFSDVQWFIC